MTAPDPLNERLARLGRTLAEREASHQPALSEARKRADSLHAVVCQGLDAYRGAVREAGAEHLDVQLGPVRLDEKHVRAVEFEVARGRTRALVVVKSRGEVTLVGPFRTGKAEGPCQTLAWDAEDEILPALGDFLERFLDEAATP